MTHVTLRVIDVTSWSRQRAAVGLGSAPRAEARERSGLLEVPFTGYH